MKKRNYNICALILLSLFFGKANAQMDFRSKYGIATLPVLKIGDQVPDFIIPNLFNSSNKTAKMSDFKDQLLVLDFWATWCSGCVAGLPHMEELQKKFGDKVKMLPVTYQNEKEVIPFWKSIPYTKDLTISTVIGDKQLLSYFPHKTITHDVWIYKGKVIAETGADYLTAENIKKVLSGAVINWPVKNDFNFFNGNLQPLFKLDSNQINTKNTPVKYTAISDYKPNITPPFLNSGIYTNGIVRDTIKKTIRVFEINTPIYNLYNINWLMANMGKISQLVKPSGTGANEVVWEVADKYKYIKDPKSTQAEWMVRNGICYESLNPDTGQTDHQIYQNTIQDLNRLLGLKVRWEKRKEKVLVLIHTSQEDKLKSKKVIGVVVLPDGRQPGYLKEKREIHKGNLYQFRDIPLPIVGYMNNEETNPYVFDETGYTNKVDMDLNIPSWTDIAAVRKAIKPYGLDLKEEERLVDKFVFTEINGGLLVDVQAQHEAKAKRTAQTDSIKFAYQKPLFDFDYKKSVFKLENEQVDNTNRMLRFSVLTGYREGVKPFAGMMNSEVFNDQRAGTSKYCLYNLSIQDMLTNGAKSEQVVLNVKDPAKYRYDPSQGDKEIWMRKNAYCYEFTLPSATYSMSTIKAIKEDCAYQFHVKVTIGKKKVGDQEVEIYTITEL